MRIAVIGLTLAVVLGLGGLTEGGSDQRSSTKTDKSKIVVTDNSKKDRKGEQPPIESEDKELVLDIVTGFPIY